MGKFKVGDKVRIRSWEDLKDEFGLDRNGDINTEVTVLKGSMKACCGNVYTIRKIVKHDFYFSLYFDETCFIFSDDSIEPVKKNHSIVIYQEGRQVVALDKSTGKTVRCGIYDDDFYKAADAAFKKLVKKDSEPKSESKEYNDEIICVEANTYFFTKGKVYKVVDGYVTNDERVKEGKFADFDSLNKGLLSKFIRVVK